MSKKSKRKRRRFFLTKHHLTNKVNGGKDNDENILVLKWEQHHCAWHKLFGNLSLEEIIKCLQRVAKMKHRPPLEDGTCQG